MAAKQIDGTPNLMASDQSAVRRKINARTRFPITCKMAVRTNVTCAVSSNIASGINNVDELTPLNVPISSEKKLK